MTSVFLQGVSRIMTCASLLTNSLVLQIRVLWSVHPLSRRFVWVMNRMAFWSSRTVLIHLFDTSHPIPFKTNKLKDAQCRIVESHSVMAGRGIHAGLVLHGNDKVARGHPKGSMAVARQAHENLSLIGLCTTILSFAPITPHISQVPVPVCQLLRLL